MALGLAVLSGLLGLVFPIGGLCLALGALPFGIWGALGNRRATAILALCLACGLISWNLIQLLMYIYPLI